MQATASWKTWTERLAMAMIAIGVLMLFQSVTLQLFGAGFVVIIIGTAIFIVISHL